MSFLEFRWNCVANCFPRTNHGEHANNVTWRLLYGILTCAWRYLMGVGYPVDLVVCSALGVDMFDCVFPCRTARWSAFAKEIRVQFRTLPSHSIFNRRFQNHAWYCSPHFFCFSFHFVLILNLLQIRHGADWLRRLDSVETKDFCFWHASYWRRMWLQVVNFGAPRFLFELFPLL